MDVMLIDPQDLTAMLLDDKVKFSGRMVRLIAKRGDQADVGVFHRCELMRHWHVHNSISFERMLDPTDLGQAQSLKFSGFSLSEMQIRRAIVRQHDPRVSSC